MDQTRDPVTELTAVQEDLLAILYLQEKSKQFQINRFADSYAVCVGGCSERRERLKDAIFAALRAAGVIQ